MSEENGRQDKEAADKGAAAEVSENGEDMLEEELLAAIEADADAGQEGGQEGGNEDSQGSGFSDPLEALAADNHQLDAEITALKDKLLRTVAEMENLRRRTQKDVAEAKAYSVAGFARDMLGVADNLHRAIAHVDEKDKQQSGLKSLIEGVEMTERELLGVLEKNGVKKISPLNEKFNPNFHQAMFEVKNGDVPNNTVIEIVQEGFMIAERMLRPAMVGVAKGGPKQSPGQTGADAEVDVEADPKPE